MGNTTSKKYPTCMGDLDREWLIMQLPNAKYPNALLEIALHPYPSGTLCNFAYVTDDVLVEFVLGKDDLTWSEFSGLVQGMSNFKYESADFMLLESLEICKDEQRIRHAKDIIDGVCKKYNHIALDLIQMLLGCKKVPVSAVDNAERFEKWAKRRDDFDKSMNRKYRSTKLEESA